MAEITMEMLMEKAQVLLKLADECRAATDNPEKMAELSERMQAEGAALEALGKRYQQEQMMIRTKGRGLTTVVLTPDQRRRIKEKSGIDVETYQVEDDGTFKQGMPARRVEEIEALALAKAMKEKYEIEAERMVRAELDRLMEDIENVGVAELSEQLARLKQDPNFAGGLLLKKPR